ncbi:MAG: hypothetical protein JW715_05080 [Sedimentisphaerales bacterium]|nr:hypothetical protein [Sedimentisphaerales bacterium]
MNSKHRIILALIMMSALTLASLPCSFAQDVNDRNASNEDGIRMSRPGQGLGPRQGERGMRERDDGGGRRSGGRGGPGGQDRDGGRRGPRGGQDRPGRGPDIGWRRPELTDENYDQILLELEKRDPNSAKELSDLRKKDPRKFESQLRRIAWPEMNRVIIKLWDGIRRKEFLEWLEEYIPEKAAELARLKENESDLYNEQYELIRQQYIRIYDRARWNPELTKVLIADLQLTERESELLKRIKSTDSEEEKSMLMAQLEDLEGDRYDLIVRRKQIAYELLLKRLQALQNEVKASIEDINKSMDEEVKANTVKERMKELTEGKPRGFGWY